MKRQKLFHEIFRFHEDMYSQKTYVLVVGDYTDSVSAVIDYADAR